ncbi:MAG: hypothetical protein ACLFVK_06870 [Dehalococcoidia bacterium]
MNKSLLISSIIILCTIGLSVVTYNRWWELRFEVGPVYFSHLLGWLGFAFIAIWTPIYYYLKRKIPTKFKMMLTIHNIGNLLAFMLISMHFAQQVGRPAEYYPALGTGLVLYVSVCLMVICGFLLRFQLARRLNGYWRFIHTSFVLPFYLMVIIHILHGFGIV